MSVIALATILNLSTPALAIILAVGFVAETSSEPVNVKGPTVPLLFQEFPSPSK